MCCMLGIPIFLTYIVLSIQSVTCISVFFIKSLEFFFLFLQVFTISLPLYYKQARDAGMELASLACLCTPAVPAFMDMGTAVCLVGHLDTFYNIGAVAVLLQLRVAVAYLCSTY